MPVHWSFIKAKLQKTGKPNLILNDAMKLKGAT